MKISIIITRQSSEKGIKKHSVLRTTPQNHGNQFCEEDNKLYTENYTARIKEIKEKVKKWHDIEYYWSRNINIIKIRLLLKAILQFWIQYNPYENLNDIFSTKL